MKKILFLLLISCLCLSVINNAICEEVEQNSVKVSEDDIIQKKKIPGTPYAYCLYTKYGTLIANKNSSGSYNSIDAIYAKEQVQDEIEIWKEKYLISESAKEKAYCLKRIYKYERTLNAVNTCLNFNMSKLACGIFTNPTTKKINKKVIGGAKCTNEKKSAVAKIVIDYGSRKENDNDICTGTLIGKNVFLTAAHCFYATQDFDVDSKLDASRIGKLIHKVKVTLGKKTYKATKWLTNPLWDRMTGANDIALVYIGKNLKKKPFKLIKKNYVPKEKDFAAIIGYGVHKYKRKKPIYGYFGGFVTLSDVSDSLLTSSYIKGSNDATICFGDSGGPLVSWIDDAWRILGTATGGSVDYCGYYTGHQIGYWSRINAPENVSFLEKHIPDIFDK